MKKDISIKLTISKETIANLDREVLGGIKGGTGHNEAEDDTHSVPGADICPTVQTVE